MFNRSHVFLKAHKDVRENRKRFPVHYGSISYAEAFAITLKYVWLDARLGKLNAPATRQDEIKGEIVRIELKTRMSNHDFGRVDMLRGELRRVA